MRELRNNKYFEVKRNFMAFFLILCLSVLPMFSTNQDIINEGLDFILPSYAAATDNTSSGVGGIDVRMGRDGDIILDSDSNLFDGNSNNSWNTMFDRYKSIIAGLSGFATLTMLAAFIFLLTKLGTTSGNEKERRNCIIGILFTGIATAGLGAVTIIMAFFYNSFAGL